MNQLPTLRALLSTATALLLLLLAATAGADGSSRARRHFEHGQQLYASGQYEPASAEFRKAFEFDARPKYLYNAAQALRLAGDCRGSVALYEAFVRIAPDSDSRAAATRNIERCGDPEAAPANASASATPAASATTIAPATTPTTGAPAVASPATSAPAASTPETATSLSAAAAEPSAAEPNAPAPEPAAIGAPAATAPTLVVSAAPAPARISPKWIGAVGATATGAALLTASLLEGLGASQFHELTRTCAPDCQSSDVLPLQRQLDAATGLFVVSGVLAAATIVALVVTHVHAHPAR